MSDIDVSTARKAFMKELLKPRASAGPIDTKAVGRPVPIVPFHDWDFYYITEDLTWRPEPANAADYDPVTAPRYFVTDLASIPEEFWSSLPPTGAYSYPAIIHDWLYWTQPHAKTGDDDRAYADSILQQAMSELHVPAEKAEIIYGAVRLFGGAAWSNNAALRAAGEKRVLKKVPDDANVTWAQWKADPGNFA